MERKDDAIGLGILALVTALAGMLAVLMAGAILLLTGAGGDAANPMVPGSLLAFGLLYLSLAYSVHVRHALARRLAVVLLIALVVASAR